MDNGTINMGYHKLVNTAFIFIETHFNVLYAHLWNWCHRDTASLNGIYHDVNMKIII